MLLQLEGVAKRFKRSGEFIDALSDFTLAVPAGAWAEALAVLRATADDSMAAGLWPAGSMPRGSNPPPCR